VSGRWLLPAGDIGFAAYSVHEQESGPLTEIDLGPAGAPVLQFRDLDGLDDLIGVLVAARAEHGQAQARHAARPLMPPPGRDAGPGWAAPAIDLGVGAVMEVLIDPDCIAGKHATCMGGPCTCSCHAPSPVTQPDPPDLPHRAPAPAPEGEPTCDEMDGNFACTASPLHPGDHAAHDRDGSVAHQWERAPASEDAAT
jgi:hypothetical protein